MSYKKQTKTSLLACLNTVQNKYGCNSGVKSTMHKRWREYIVYQIYLKPHVYGICFVKQKVMCKCTMKFVGIEHVIFDAFVKNDQLVFLHTLNDTRWSTPEIRDKRFVHTRIRDISFQQFSNGLESPPCIPRLIQSKAGALYTHWLHR